MSFESFICDEIELRPNKKIKLNNNIDICYVSDIISIVKEKLNNTYSDKWDSFEILDKIAYLLDTDTDIINILNRLRNQNE
jgi:uncharacterized 2Fe-2S/4Fe-4S cluster protein (DUF4445 family)